MAMLKSDQSLSTSEPGRSGVTGKGSGHTTVLGKGSHFEGTLAFDDGEVHIEGEFNGSIVTNAGLVVEREGKVNAEVSCGTIVVHGTVTGNIRAKGFVELHETARVRGNIESPSLMVQKGVVFEGQSRMENLDKNSGAAKPATGATPPATAAKA